MRDETEESIDSVVNGEDNMISEMVPYAEYLRVVNNIIKMTRIRDKTRQVYTAIDIKLDEIMEATGIEDRPRKRAGQFGETDVKVPRIVYDAALLVEDEVRRKNMTTIKQAGAILDVVADEILKASPRGRPVGSNSAKTDKEIAAQKTEETKSKQQKERQEKTRRTEYSVPEGRVAYFAFDALAQRLIKKRFSMREISIDNDDFLYVYKAVRGFIASQRGNDTVSIEDYKILVNLVAVHDVLPNIDGKLDIGVLDGKKAKDLSSYKALVEKVLANDEEMQKLDAESMAPEMLAPNKLKLMQSYNPEREYALGQLVRRGLSVYVVTEKIFKHRIRLVGKEGLDEILVECDTETGPPKKSGEFYIY